jgi:hypothetical protein
MKYLITLLLIFTISCSQDFNKPRYQKIIKTRPHWQRKQIPFYRQGTYRDHNVKKQTRQKLIKPPTININ